MASRKKNFAVTVRMSEDIKDATERAAKDDARSVTSLVEKLLLDHLRAKGYLTGAAKPKGKGQ